MTIAHRLLTIADYDRVLVFDKGQLVESDAPIKLLVDDIDDDEITLNGSFADMVKHTGKKTSSKIIDIARKSYLRKKNNLKKNA
jgi:ABC-type multidrug transport system fused ATPase/permease subunit